MFGFRWLQRIRLPFGFRSTVSRSGIGYSWGVPGLRVGVSPSGRKWISLGFPRLGLSFFRYLGNNNTQRDAVFIDDDELVEFNNRQATDTHISDQINEPPSSNRGNTGANPRITRWKNIK